MFSRKSAIAPVPDLFASLLQVIAECETSVEAARQSLAEDPAFSYFQVYKLLDPTRDHLTAAKLQQFAEFHGVELTAAEAYALLRGMDWNDDGQVSATDFSMSILPWRYPNLRELAASRETSAVVPSVETMRLVIRWLNYEVLYYRNTDRLKQVLSGKGALGDLFRAVCRPRSDSFTLQDLAEYCRSVGYSASEATLTSVFYRLSRYSSATVKYCEFVKSLSPVCSPAPRPATQTVAGRPVTASFVSVCRDMVRLDSRLEQLKCDLASRADFTIADAFRLFDAGDLGYLRMEDIRECCRALKIFPTAQELYRLLRRFGSCEGNHVSLREFEAFLLPQSQTFAQSLLDKVPILAADRGLVFTPKTAAILKALFATAIDHESQIARNKENVTSPEVLRDLFSMLDCGRDGAVSEKDFALGLARLGERYSHTELSLLYKRIEKRGRPGFDFSAFCEEFSQTRPKW